MTTLLRQPNERANSSVAASVPSADGKPLVLVVEDHDDTRFLLSYQLEILGCRVVFAGDGEEAVGVAEKSRPDLILMDARLPGLDGLGATRRIRKLAPLAGVPIVFLSGDSQPAFRATALESGINDYLLKPFNLSDLEGALKRHLGGAVAGRAR